MCGQRFGTALAGFECIGGQTHVGFLDRRVVFFGGWCGRRLIGGWNRGQLDRGTGTRRACRFRSATSCLFPTTANRRHLARMPRSDVFFTPHYASQGAWRARAIIIASFRCSWPLGFYTASGCFCRRSFWGFCSDRFCWLDFFCGNLFDRSFIGPFSRLGHACQRGLRTRGANHLHLTRGRRFGWSYGGDRGSRPLGLHAA